MEKVALGPSLSLETQQTDHWTFRTNLELSKCTIWSHQVLLKHSLFIFRPLTDDRSAFNWCTLRFTHNFKTRTCGLMEIKRSRQWMAHICSHHIWGCVFIQYNLFLMCWAESLAQTQDCHWFHVVERVEPRQITFKLANLGPTAVKNNSKFYENGL